MYVFKAIIYILVIHSGWVQTVYYHDLGYGNKICVLNALVNPSQCLSEKPHEPWIAVDKLSGTVVTAHCTCMAGYVTNVCQKALTTTVLERFAHMWLQFCLKLKHAYD